MIFRAAGCLFFVVIAVVAALMVRDYVRRHPQDVPWTELTLDQPIGRFTGRKLAGLHEDTPRCRALLAAAGSEARAAPSRRDGEQCGYNDGMRLQGDALRFAPGRPVTSCSVAAGLHVFEQQVLQAAAFKHFGKKVVSISHVGSYSCRRLYNRADGPFSEHATANAFDITGFTLESGERISILRDWSASGPKSDFLRDVRDGACSLFATVLSPDYNAAHADHLHLDQASRGSTGWRMCR